MAGVFPSLGDVGCHQKAYEVSSLPKFDDSVANLTRILFIVGEQRLSAHQVVKAHALPIIL